MVNLDKTGELESFVDEKMVKIKRGYSPEFAKTYYSNLKAEVEQIL